MQYQSDYILRLIESMGALIRRAMEKVRSGGSEESYDLATEAIGLALDLDPATAARLSPQSLASLLELRMPDDRVLELTAEALDIAAESLERDAEIVEAQLRRDQATAVRGLLDPGRAN